MDEITLVQRAQGGDAEAFGALVRQVQGALLACARQMTRRIEDAEDLAQEALLEAYRCLPTLREPEKFRTWLFSILRHKCLTARRRERPELPLENAESLPAPLPTDGDALQGLLDLLPDADRELLAAHYLQGLSCAEIATLYGSNAVAIRMRVSRARARLRQLAKHEEEEMRSAFAVLLALPTTDLSHRVMTEVSTMTQLKFATGGVAALTVPTMEMGLAAVLMSTGTKIAIGVGVALLLLLGAAMIPITPGGGTTISLLAATAGLQEQKEPREIFFEREPGGTFSSVGGFTRDHDGNYYCISSVNPIDTSNPQDYITCKYRLSKHDADGVVLWQSTLPIQGAFLSGMAITGNSLYLLHNPSTPKEDTIYRFTLDGKLRGQWTIKPSLNANRLIAGPHGALIVSGDEITTYSATGEVIATEPRPYLPEDRPLQGNRKAKITKLAIGPDDMRYVVCGYNEILAFTPKGKVKAFWPVFDGTYDPRNSYQYTLTTDRKGNLWVAYYGTNKLTGGIKCFSPDGHQLRHITTASNGQPLGPITSLELDDDGTIYAFDRILRGVRVMPPER